MEKLEQMGRTTEAANGGAERLREMAEVECEHILAGAAYQSLETPGERAGYLRGLVLEFGATVEDTPVPVDNSKRFLVELLAFELWKVEQEEQSELARVAAERMAVTS